MDPRHPELAIPYMKDLLKRYDRISSDIKAATVGPRLSELEREGAAVVNELSLAAPRMHEALMVASRTRRAALARGLVYTESEKGEDDPLVAEPEAEKTETPLEEPAPVPKTTKRTKSTKKAKK